MEMLQAGQPDHFNMLESAENCLGSPDQSGKVVALRGRPAEAAPTPEPLPSVIENVREMAAAGLCERVYGGALPVAAHSASLKERIQADPERKMRVAQAAISRTSIAGAIRSVSKRLQPRS